MKSHENQVIRLKCGLSSFRFSSCSVFLFANKMFPVKFYLIGEISQPNFHMENLVDAIYLTRLLKNKTMKLQTVHDRRSC